MIEKFNANNSRYRIKWCYIKQLVNKYFCSFVTLPLIIVYYICNKECKDYIKSDVAEMNRRLKIKKSLGFYLLFYKAYRNLFYYRLKNIKILKILKFIYKPYPLFYISAEHIGKCCFVLNHPYATIINCKSIGNNFTISHLTTIGNKRHGRNDLIPIIGDNVSLGANVSVLGNIKIGDNVIVGAGSVVVSDIPDNCIAVGNPAKKIKSITNQ